MNQIAQAIGTIDRTAKKYKAKVTISALGQKEVVIADHRNDKTITESLKSLLIESVQKTRSLTHQIKEKSEELKDGLQAIPDYRRTELEADKAVLEKKKKKNNYMQRPELAKIEAQLKELRTERKENKETQSSYATELYRLTQMNLFDLPNGTEIHIQPKATVAIKMQRLRLGR